MLRNLDETKEVSEGKSQIWKQTGGFSICDRFIGIGKLNWDFKNWARLIHPKKRHNPANEDISTAKPPKITR